MKRNNFIYSLLGLILAPQFCFAYFCPTNFNQINNGDTIDQVKQLCGNPDLEVTKDAVPNVPQEWTYFISQTVSMGNLEPAQGTLKTSVSFDQSGKAINISVNGVGVGSSLICGGNIQLGDTEEAIKNACGKPAFINKQQEQPAPGTQTPTSKMTELTYHSNPPTVLMFKDGLLTGKK